MNINQEWNWLKYKLKISLAGIKDPRGSFPGMLSYEEGLLLARLAANFPINGVIVEIGCYKGLSSAYLIEGARKRNGYLYSIDPFDAGIEQQRKDSTNKGLSERKYGIDKVKDDLIAFGGKNFELIEGFSYEVVKTWGKRIDLLWIDGNHEYNFVRQDYEQWYGFLNPGGIIAFHDSNKLDNKEGWTRYGWEGPTRLVKEVLKPPIWGDVCVIDSITYAIKCS